MITIEEYQLMLNRLEELKRKHDQAEGALKERMQTLLKHFGCESIEDAEELLAKLVEEVQQLEQELELAEKRFRKKYGKYLQ